MRVLIANAGATCYRLRAYRLRRVPCATRVAGPGPGGAVQGQGSARARACSVRARTRECCVVRPVTKPPVCMRHRDALQEDDALTCE